MKDNEACENGLVSHLTQELKAANGRIDSLKHAIKTLDEHSEHLMVYISYFLFIVYLQKIL